MNPILNQLTHPLQAQPEELERFSVFKVKHSLGTGIKSRMKGLGCSWNAMLRGWICPEVKQKEVQKILQEAKLHYEAQTVTLPKGIVPADPKMAGRQSHLQILEEEICKEDRQLLQDVCRYDLSLRPEDFAQVPPEESKSPSQLDIERDFNVRYADLQKKREEIEQARKELSHLNADQGNKILSSDAPLLIADALIQSCFLSNGHRTLQYCLSTFWRWDGTKYIELSDDEMRQIIYEFLRDAKKLNSAGHLECFNPNKFKVDQVVDALHATCHQNHHPASGAVWLDGRKEPSPQHLISFRNGLLDLKNWMENPTDLISHTPLLLNVNSLPFDFDPCAPEPREWLQFLNSIWPDDLESHQTLQEWTGYLLLPDTRQHKILLMVGPTRSGKGTIGRVLRELLGPFNVAGPTLSSLGGEFGLQPLLNKMLALISDARLYGKGNNSVIVERLLSISGEDPLTVNRKFQSPLTVQLPTRIMMMSNELPDMRDASGALVNRYLVLTLQRSWLGIEDTSLFTRLCIELPGILLWALKGLVRLQKRGKFIQPASSTQTIEDLEAITSPITAFIKERCEFKPYATIPVASLFNAWCDWCNVNGYRRPGNVQSFGKNLFAAFPEIKKTRPQEDLTRERCYEGISFRSGLNSYTSADARGQTRTDLLLTKTEEGVAR